MMGRSRVFYMVSLSKELNKSTVTQDNYCTELICVPLLRNVLFTNQPTTNRIASLICETLLNYFILEQPTTQPICNFVLVILFLNIIRTFIAPTINTGLMSPHQNPCSLLKATKTESDSRMVV